MKAVFKGAAIAAAVSVLVACGGGGDDGLGYGGGAADDTSVPASGKVAKVIYGEIPGYDPVTSNIEVLAVTNRGLYLRDTDSGGGTRVHKLHGDPSFSNAWSTANFTGGLYDVAPLNIYSEGEREVSFYYASYGGVWGLYSSNIGTPSFESRDDIGISKISQGHFGGTMTGPWVIARGPQNINNDLQYVYHDDKIYTSANSASDTFGAPAELLPIGQFGLVFSHPTDAVLFVSGYGTLRSYSSSSRLTTENLPTEVGEFNWITDMMWYDGALWFSMNSKVYRRNGPGDFTVVVDMPLIRAGSALEGRFCIKGGEILTADGMATNIITGRQRNFLYSGNLTESQALEGVELLSSLVQIFCSPDNLSSVVYAPPSTSAPSKIRMIEILR